MLRTGCNFNFYFHLLLWILLHSMNIHLAGAKSFQCVLIKGMEIYKLLSSILLLHFIVLIDGELYTFCAISIMKYLIPTHRHCWRTLGQVKGRGEWECVCVWGNYFLFNIPKILSWDFQEHLDRNVSGCLLVCESILLANSRRWKWLRETDPVCISWPLVYTYVCMLHLKNKRNGLDTDSQFFLYCDNMAAVRERERQKGSELLRVTDRKGNMFFFQLSRILSFHSFSSSSSSLLGEHRRNSLRYRGKFIGP